MKISYRLTLLGLLMLVLALSGCTRSRSGGAAAPVLAAPDAQAAAQGGATISLVTAKPTVNQGEEFKVDVKVSGVQDLYAGDVRLQFDPARLEVIDANPGVPGVQIEVGKFPDPSAGQGFVAQNLADNAAGRIAYAVTLLSPAKPVSGEGTMATVTFRAKAAGPPAVSFLSALLTKQDNSTIQTNTAALGAGGGAQAGATGQAPAGATPQAQAPAGATAAPKAAGATPQTQAPAGATPQTQAPAGATPRAAAPGAQAVVSIDPATANIAAVGGTATVNVRVSNVTDLFGADVRLTFNPAFVEVVDADAGPAGVQITPGDCFPAGSQIARNAADNTAGNITFAASKVGQVPGASGACTIASINFRGKAAGSSPVDYQRDPQLANNQGVAIPASWTGGTVTVGGGGQQATATPGAPRPTATPGMPPATATPGPGPGPGAGGNCTYVVRPGDTLAAIALRYGTTISAIANANGIANPNRIRVGQTLTIPNCSGPVQPPQPGGNCFQYTVQYGDTLSNIAARYGTSAAAIAFNNGIANPNRIRAGQRLIVCPGGGVPKPPPPSPCPGPCKSYVVRPGDTLYSIALRHNTTVYDLQRANSLANPNTIYAGQVLNVP